MTGDPPKTDERAPKEGKPVPPEGGRRHYLQRLPANLATHFPKGILHDDDRSAGNAGN